MKEEDRFALSVCMTVLGFIFVALRFFVRYFRADAVLVRRWPYLISDLFTIIALFSTLLYSAVYCWQLLEVYKTQTGEILSIGLITYLAKVRSALKWGWGLVLMYVSALYACKGALLCIYFGAAAGLDRRKHIGLYTTTIFTAATYFLVTGGFSAMCSPKQYASMDRDHCPGRERTIWSITLIALHLSTDFFVMLMGVITIRSMTPLGRSEKVAVVFIFSLGLITAVAASIRFGVQMMYIQKRSKATEWGASVVLVNWMSLAGLFEMNLALIAISLPSMRVLLRRMRKRSEVDTGDSHTSSDMVIARTSLGRRVGGYTEMLELERIDVAATEKT